MFEIRSATEADAPVLAEIAERTFVETFAKDNRPEDMAEYVANTFGPEKQRAEIRDPRRRIAIAWKGSQAAGFSHLYAGEVDPAVTGDRPIELLRLYVASDWHGKGVASLLMDRCIADARSARYATLWLGVWERNFRAQAFYRKYGFETCGSHVFYVGQDPQTDLIMWRAL